MTRNYSPFIKYAAISAAAIFGYIIALSAFTALFAKDNTQYVCELYSGQSKASVMLLNKTAIDTLSYQYNLRCTDEDGNPTTISQKP